MKSIKEIFVVKEAGWEAPDMAKSRPPGVPNSGTGRKLPPPLDKLSSQEMKTVEKWMDQESGFEELPREVEDKLLYLFKGEISQGVLKNRTGDLDRWLMDTIDGLLNGPKLGSWMNK